MKNDAIHSTLLPSPSHSITSLYILHTSDPFHLTAHSTCHPDVPSTHTLIASLSDNSLIAWDLDRHCTNQEWNLLTWLIPYNLARSVNVLMSVFVMPERRIVGVATKDQMLLLKCCVEGEKQEAKTENEEMYLRGMKNVMKRIQLTRDVKKKVKCLNEWIDMDVKPISEYSSMLCCKPVEKDELLIIERPVLDIVKNLPKVVYRRRYGI